MISRNWPLPGPNNEKECSLSQDCMNQIRNEIDNLDLKLAKLLSRRFELSAEIGKVKAELGQSLKDEGREQQIFSRLEEELKGANAIEEIKAVFSSIISESLALQERSLGLEQERSELAGRLFPSVCIIGAGLIGGAFARKIKSSFPHCQVFGIDLAENVQKLEESAVFDQCSDSLESQLLDRSSLVVIACLPETSLEILQEISPRLCGGQIVLDLCSNKEAICKLADELNLGDAEFVGGHPFFGTEKSGFENSLEVKLEGRNICLIAGSKSSEISLTRLKIWLEALNLNPLELESPSQHDQTVAMTSHIIQLLASGLGAILHEELIETGKEKQLALSGGALAGLARLMASKPQIWQQIIKLNKENVSKVLASLCGRIEQMLEDESGMVLEESFAKAARLRARITEMGRQKEQNKRQDESCPEQRVRSCS